MLTLDTLDRKDVEVASLDELVGRVVGMGSPGTIAAAAVVTSGMVAGVALSRYLTEVESMLSADDMPEDFDVIEAAGKVLQTITALTEVQSTINMVVQMMPDHADVLTTMGNQAWNLALDHPMQAVMLNEKIAMSAMLAANGTDKLPN